MKPRPRIFIPRAAVPVLLAAALIALINGQRLLLAVGVVGVIGFTALTWLLAPYWSWAMRARVGTDEAYERWHRRADRLRALPLIGRYLRWWERWNGVSSEEVGRESREWARKERQRLGIDHKPEEDSEP